MEKLKESLEAVVPIIVIVLIFKLYDRTGAAGHSDGFLLLEQSF